MKLIDAVKLEQGACLALVGAGGKTTAMFRLAQEWVEAKETPILLTTSTHLAEKELGLADRHLVVQRIEDLQTLFTGDLHGVILLTGPEVSQNKVGALPADAFEALHSFAQDIQSPLLIEADGSARHPLKAPAEHEPVIPGFVDTVIVVAGMQSFGKPLGDSWVHRPEIFSQITGLALNDEITSGAIAAMLLSDSGGLKGIPDGTKRLALLNQCDTPYLAAAAKRIGKRLRNSYQRVILTALQKEGSQAVIAVDHHVAGLILAGGGSQRIGEPKQLLDWQGTPFVRAVAETAIQSGLYPVHIVVGAFSEEVAASLDGLEVQIVHNPNWPEGQSTSLAAGIKSLPPETQAVVVMLVDQPQIPPSLVEALVETHAVLKAPIVAPMVDQRRGNPVLFDRVTFADLRAVEGDVGGRKIFSKYRLQYVPWLDNRAAMDVDSLEDYHKLLDAWDID